MLVGFICVKTKYVTEEQKNALSKIIVRITLPLLIITSLTNREFNHETLINSITAFIISFAVIGILFVIGMLMSKAARMEKSQAVMHRCMSAFGNVVFMAFPLVQALYGAEGLLYAAIYALANDMFLWTLGVYQLTSIKRKKGMSFLQSLKNMLTPGTIAFLIAFFMLVTGLKFTGVVGEVMEGIGGTTTYLSMLFIGGTLATIDFRNIYRRVWLFLLTAVKMIAVPAALIFTMRLFNISDVVKSVVILQAAMPTSTVLAVLALEYEGDVNYCAEGVFISHVASLALIPLVYWLMNVI